MTILFPDHPLHRSQPDPDFAGEDRAAQTAGLRTVVFSLEDLRRGREGAAFSQTAPAASPSEPLVYRGWMMSDTLYEQLARAAQAKGYRLVTDPDQYAEAHYLPNAYAHIADETAESVWCGGRDANDAWACYSRISAGDCLIKDFVKSAKHRWHEACFIPAHTSRERFDEIFSAFLRARGNLFEKGVVFRRFHPLIELGRDLRGQPVNEEYRLFFWDGNLLAAAPSVRLPSPLDCLARWQRLARRFKSRFISLDVARAQDRDWLVIEVGDGGVSGIPDSMGVDEFYRQLARLGFSE